MKIFVSFFRPGGWSFALKSCPGDRNFDGKISGPGVSPGGMVTGQIDTRITTRTESFSDILGYTVFELKHITKKSTNQIRVHVREPKCDWPSKDKGLSHDSRSFFSSSFLSSHFPVCLCVFLDLYVRMPFQGKTQLDTVSKHNSESVGSKSPKRLKAVQKRNLDKLKI